MHPSACHRVQTMMPWVISMAISATVIATPSQDDAWAQRLEAEETVRQQIASVNEGDLSFLEGPPSEPVHHHRNRIIVTGSSLRDGWVTLEQCHRNLDRVAAAQIVFHPERSRALRVTGFQNMQTAEAHDNTIQLREVGADSQVCLTAQTRALVEIGEGVYELQNGPYMRRFLDGYYPMRVSMDIEFPARLTLADFTPDRQPGFTVSEAPGRVKAEALFEGQLRTRFRFLSD